MNKKHHPQKPGRGKILVAEPFMWDPNFKRAVVMLCEHQKEGSFGYILNRPLEMTLNELLEDFPKFDARLHFGGPVQTNTLHYLHHLGDLIPEAQLITEGVWWGGDFEQLKALIANDLVEPNQIRFYVGFSSWDEGQLNGELREGSWVLGNMDPNYVFKVKHDELWPTAMAQQSPTLGVIGQIPDGILYN